MTIEPVVTLECEPNGAFFPYFVIGESLIGGTDVIAPVSVTRTLERVKGFRIDRGRDRELDEYRTGTAAVDLDDLPRDYDPLNTDSSFYGSIEPGKTLTIKVPANGTTHTLFTGTADRWPRANRGRVPITTCIASDALGRLANQKAQEIASAHSGDLAGTRVARLLDLAEIAFPSDQRSIDAGRTTFGPTTFTEAGGNALRYAQLCARSEAGAFFATVANVLRFKQRRSAPGAVQATFSDDGAAGSIRYEDIDQDFENSTLYNQLRGSGTTGTVQVVEDTTSVRSYGYRTTTDDPWLGMLTLSDADVESHLTWLVSRFKAPTYPLRKVVVDVTTLPAARQAEVLALELDVLVTVEHTPPGGGDQIVQLSFVDGLAFEWDADTGRLTAEIAVSPADGRIGFVIGHSTLGVIGQSRITY